MTLLLRISFTLLYDTNVDAFPLLVYDSSKSNRIADRADEMTREKVDSVQPL